MAITESDLACEVDELAREYAVRVALAEMGEGEDPAVWLYEFLEYHTWVIYYHHARRVVALSEYDDDAWETVSETGATDATAWAQLLCNMAYWCLWHAVQHAAPALITETLDAMEAAVAERGANALADWGVS